MNRMASQNGHPASINNEEPNEVDLKLDRVNELWSRLERKLVRRQPPRHITILVESSVVGEYEDHLKREFLGLQRQHGKWRVCYAVDYPPCDHNGDCSTPMKDLPWKPITECDLETRLAMSARKHTDKLRQEIDETRSYFIPQLDSAISQLEEALDDE